MSQAGISIYCVGRITDIYPHRNIDMGVKSDLQGIWKKTRKWDQNCLACRNHKAGQADGTLVMYA